MFLKQNTTNILHTSHMFSHVFDSLSLMPLGSLIEKFYEQQTIINKLNKKKK